MKKTQSVREEARERQYHRYPPHHPHLHQLPFPLYRESLTHQRAAVVVMKTQEEELKVLISDHCWHLEYIVHSVYSTSSSCEGRV